MIHWYRAYLRSGVGDPASTSRTFPSLADGKVPVPMLILWGEEDRFLSRKMASESLAFCSQGRCLLFPGVSHWIQHEEPARVSCELIAHFAPNLTAG